MVTKIKKKSTQKVKHNAELMKAWNQGVAVRLGLLVYPIIKDVTSPK